MRPSIAVVATHIDVFGSGLPSLARENQREASRSSSIEATSAGGHSTPDCMSAPPQTAPGIGCAEGRCAPGPSGP